MSDDYRPNRFTRLSTAGAACVLLWISRTLFGLLVSYPLSEATRASGITRARSYSWSRCVSAPLG